MGPTHPVDRFRWETGAALPWRCTDAGNNRAGRVNLGFYHEVDVADPEQVLEGSGKRLRHVKVFAADHGLASPMSVLRDLVSAGCFPGLPACVVRSLPDHPSYDTLGQHPWPLDPSAGTERMTHATPMRKEIRLGLITDDD